MSLSEDLLDGDPMDADVLVVTGTGSFSREQVLDAIEEASRDRACLLQALDPGAVFDAAHARAAARRALRSHRDGRGIARDPGVEIALYVACTTQIEDAFEGAGLPERGTSLVLVGVGPERGQGVEAVLEEVGLEREPLEGENREALERLGLSDFVGEQGGEASLWVRERVALLDARG